MANLKLSEVSRIAAEVAREVSPDLHVAGVTHGAGSGEYAEIILNVQGCRQEPCQVALGVIRTQGKAALRDHIASKLQDHLREHRG